MPNDLDEIDFAIMKYLEKDARQSLKKLAEDIDQKVSTIYHRVNKLISDGVISGFTTLINPKLLNIKVRALLKISLRTMTIPKLDTMFLGTFSKYLEDQFPQIIFIGVEEKAGKIILISVHVSKQEHNAFVETLESNTFIESVEAEKITKFIKGNKLLTFNQAMYNKKSPIENIMNEEPKEFMSAENKLSFEEEDEDLLDVINLDE